MYFYYYMLRGEILYKVLLSFIFITCLIACNVNEDGQNKNFNNQNDHSISETELPPDGYLQFDNTKVPLIMGTYSWNHIESDSPPPNELTSDTTPLIIDEQEDIQINFNTDIQPSQLHIYNWTGLKKGEEVTVFDENLFTPPHEDGEYMYGIEAIWPEGKVLYGIKIKVVR